MAECTHDWGLLEEDDEWVRVCLDCDAVEASRKAEDGEPDGDWAPRG